MPGSPEPVSSAGSAGYVRQQQDIIVVDGKCVRGSHDGHQSAIQLVSAWSTTTGLTPGQVRTAGKSNEITAIPELLNSSGIRGGVITIDAMGCQHDIAPMIVQRGADYVLGVRDNQPGLASRRLRAGWNVSCLPRFLGLPC